MDWINRSTDQPINPNNELDSCCLSFTQGPRCDQWRPKGLVNYLFQVLVAVFPNTFDVVCD